VGKFLASGYKTRVFYSGEFLALQELACDALLDEAERLADLGDCPGNPLDAPSHVFRAKRPLGFAEFANAHLRSAAARHLKDVAVGRGHLKDAVLIAKDFGWI